MSVVWIARHIGSFSSCGTPYLLNEYIALQNFTLLLQCLQRAWLRVLFINKFLFFFWKLYFFFLWGRGRKKRLNDGNVVPCCYVRVFERRKSLKEFIFFNACLFFLKHLCICTVL
jgi:hypothetical protein